MAASSLFLLLLLFVCFTISSSAVGFGGGGKVGGRTEIADVESNREIQDLGQFSVEEYNYKLRRGGAARLSFSRVVEAERQVVSGIKYYLRIEARDRHTGRLRTFDAVVVVRPWAKVRDLLSFTPSSSC